MKIYISGPMTGHDDYNRKRFNEVSAKLSSLGHTVFNPAFLPCGLEYDDYIDIARIIIKRMDAIYMLKGWHVSRGAQLELECYLAKEDGMRVMCEGESETGALLHHGTQVGELIADVLIGFDGFPDCHDCEWFPCSGDCKYPKEDKDVQ